MKRRTFLSSLASLTTLPSLPVLGTGSAAATAALVTASGAAVADCGRPRPSYGAPWDDILSRLPPSLAAHVADPAHEVQAIYTRIDRDHDQRATLTAFPLQLAPDRWFTAASWVKLPAVLLTAERLTHLGGDVHAHLVLDAPPAAGNWDASEPLDEPFERTVRRLFTVSENVPFNRLYEYLGQSGFADGLQAHGYPPAWIIARLGSNDVERHRSVGGVSIRDAAGGLLERREPRTSAAAPAVPFASTLKGRGWQTESGQVVAGPHDFSHTNFIPLPVMHDMLTALVLPDAVPASRAWAITPSMREVLLTELSRWPRESTDPPYQQPEHVDGYAKYFIVGDRGEPAPAGLRLFSKSGQAYGYLQDCAYLTDRETGVECLLTATIHVNADGIYNDDRYEYDDIAKPFLAALGRAVLDHERGRQGAGRPDFRGLPTRWTAA